MKLKVLITILLLCFCSVSFGQDYKSNLTSVKTIDDQLLEEKYDANEEVAVADRLVLKTSVEKISEKDKQFFSRKEWRKIKKQLLKNKKRISKSKEAIHTTKIMDTVFIEIPIKNNLRSSLSGW
ncbi:hypothetical protein D1816_11890 [Aquimarina sp. AD10]|uniref:hypothetical protein n=1 Tax=Aquimarina TaxID=290174 RepID=UPI000E4ACDF8|nr:MULTISPECIES: hypothetical protein [Aquimarina]AXT61017.1 hypothetical protein D1816_11890 [Aquimarina sp. AD10]RKM96315.1 hypothetical protein D7033_15625 [Aquimarina sp. AD10]